MSTAIAEKPIRSYRVEIEYCSEVVFKHDHTNSADAFVEYAQMIGAGLEPERLAAEAKHVRQVTLYKLEDGDEVFFIETPIFGCEHRPAPAEVTV